MLHVEVASVLIDIEAELRCLEAWDTQPPPAAALASTQPFAIDTLTLPQWLQFIFLPTMYRLIEDEAPLPARCGIAPMAEEHFRDDPRPVQGLIDALEAVDDLLSGGRADYGTGGVPSGG